MTILVRCDKYKQLKPPMALTAECSKAAVLLLFIHYLLLLPLFVGVLCLVVVLLCSTLCNFWFCNPPAGEGMRELVA